MKISTDDLFDFRKRAGSLAWWLCVWVGLIITLIPFIWMVASSFKSSSQIFAQLSPFSYKALLPGTSLEAYKNIFAKEFGTAIFNTALIATITIFTGLLTNSMAGFGFAKFDFPGKTILFILVFISFAVPFEAIAVPLFLFVQRIGWYDSYTALIVPGIAHGLVIFLYRQFFLGVPNELVEAAHIDGASWWKIYWNIFLPMTKHVSIGAGIVLFIFQWESFLWPVIAAPSPRYRVIQVAVARFSTQYAILWNEQFAASAIGAVIPLVFILFLQKHFVSAMVGIDLK